jgi:hypothetical protein
MFEIEDLSIPWSKGEAPEIDNPDRRVTDNHIVEHYAEHGYAVMDEKVPDDLIEEYCDTWMKYAPKPNGWAEATPYRRHGSLLNICSWGPMHEVMQQIIGEPMGLHLNLTGWRSTTRNWHQDGYLNPDSNKDHYIAVWIALDDIDVEAGPFQFIAGSHRMPWTVRNQLMRDALTPDEANSPMWPTYSERILTPIFESIIADQGLNVTTYLPSKGDVLLWHARLLHRGSSPVDPNLERKALIAHYSGIHHRPDMPKAVKSGDGWQFPL